MANDVASKTNSNNNSENSLPSNIDQQKVPPLRIVLNTAGNQKSSSTAAINNSQQASIKREKTQDAKTDGALKGSGRVRIKLATSKQQANKTSGSSNESTSIAANKSSADGGQKIKSSNTGDRQEENLKEDTTTTSYSHLRRITRRSQRAVQLVSNDDEESISSMTSIDENQNTNNINNSDNNASQETDQSNVTITSTSTFTNTTSTTTSSNATNGSSNAETPRRYKRRKGETSESLSLESDSLFGLQNYKLPVQNSFELFKNIRKQVDKKLNNLSSVHPKAPYGFRDYMFIRGAYLLDGNKLGNGTNLFMGEDGALHSTPIGKYHALRHNKINYSVPNRAKVPLGLPVNSPLYDLFIEQEKERYRMRMQHIKEREKLTLAAEQEIMRVYNQAALAAVNQTEPFSVCTMLKHQEIYNYLDSDGFTILSREDAQQDQAKPDGVRTRRRQHGQISPPPVRRNSSIDESANADLPRKEAKVSECSVSGNETQRDETKQSFKNEGIVDTESSSTAESETTKGDVQMTEERAKPGSKSNEIDKTDENYRSSPSDAPKETEQSKTLADDKQLDFKSPDDKRETPTQQDADIIESDEKKKTTKTKANNQPDSTEKTNSDSVEPKAGLSSAADHVDKEDELSENVKKDNMDEAQNQAELSENPKNDDMLTVKREQDQTVPMKQGAESQPEQVGSPKDAGNSLTEEDRRAYNKEIFLSQLQEIDDKWEKIRHEMLVRHRNEAESLHAVQKLEWEWKTKEIGACDVRTTPIIDSTLVPKLDIYSQDY